jgi:hypothetical protein
VAEATCVGCGACFKLGCPAIARGAQTLRDLPWSPYPSLDALIASDFAEDRVVFPAGWMVSVTEARQCALFTMQG